MSKRHRNYNQYSNPTPTQEPVTETEEEIGATTDPVEEEDPYIEGKVFDCSRLNVREHPSMNAIVLCEIPVDSAVRIDTRFVDEENQWYKIVNASGVEGYCMQDYISLTE